MTATEQTTPQARVLVVDDEDSFREALARFLEKSGFAVTEAASGMQALTELKRERFELILLDLRMPGMSGSDVVSEALDIDPDLAILMLSGASDATSAAICMQRGAFDYLTKPIELSNLRNAIDRALRRRDTFIQNREISSWLKEELAARTKELERERQKLQQITIATLEALINALEAKDPYVIGHSARVAALSATIAHELELSDDQIEMVRTGARLHDIGKIGIRESVLTKQGPLTPEEYDHVKDHVTIGYQILAPLTHLGPIISYVRSHHEHWDGNGYPDGLSGESIPVGARIICAAEIFDALTTTRPYQEKLQPEAACERMRLLAGNVLDPDVMDALSAAVERRKTLVFLSDEQNGFH